jgi:uncharacterized protein YcbX
VRAIYRFPVKSMRGELLDSAALRWHGLAGDRRYAFVRSDNGSDFPWLTGRQVPRLLLYSPHLTLPDDPRRSPVWVRTPAGGELPVDGEDLLRELREQYGGPVHLMQCNRGNFDSQGLSLVSTATIEAVGAQVGRELDPAHFRANLLIESASGEPYEEEGWTGDLLTFGDREDSARARVTERIGRCAMINIDPDTAERDPSVLRTVANARDNCVGVYASTERPGAVRVGDAVRLTHRP